MSNPNDQINQANQQQQSGNAKKTTDKDQPPKKGKNQRFVLGDACPQKGCTGHMTVLSQSRTAKQRIRYLVCSTCRQAPRNNKQVLPLV